MSNQWVVVASTADARIFTLEDVSGTLTGIETLVHERSREHPSAHPVEGRRDHHDDRFASRDEPRRKEHERFAQVLADRLLEGLEARAFDTIVIFSGKHFLGLLRRHLDPSVAARVRAELDNDFSALEVTELEDRLRSLDHGAPAGHSPGARR